MIHEAPSQNLEAFAANVGREGPVAVVGGRTQWHVGGALRAGTREVAAPGGVVSFEPAEMTVRVGAGTTVRVLDEALAEHGQHVALPDIDGATVGGVLSVGHNDVRRLGRGPLRDVVLEVRAVTADGRLVKAGGPTVKNVSGYDLCRVLVGSLGTLGFFGEVVLRTRPRPTAAQWLKGRADPFELHRRLYRPASILWDGTTTWVLVEGRDGDVEHNVAVLEGEDMHATDGPPPLPAHRWSIDPSLIPSMVSLAEPFVAEVGVGIVHRQSVAPPPAPSAAVVMLTERLRQLFDPDRRLNPGRDVLAR